ncbi:hypothetical protein [Pseudonocardia spirodelae]|uniref:DivIVA domain-containing protein n=1 Tax=Pseudonocardia spirodelae TaxID=3133431 RepID=A0ABU8T3Q8_9PSEU
MSTERDDTGVPVPDGDATPPVFGTAPWGYRRAEVDAWASWVARLVEQGRRETVRADSAEATLRAALERLDALEPASGAGPRVAPAPAAADGRGAATDAAGTPSAAGPATSGGPAEPLPSLPRRTPGTAGAPLPPGAADAHRLRVVETTLGEVMALLQRLAR